MPKIVLPVTKEQYDQAGGSKFVTFPAGAQVGDTLVKPVEIGIISWKTQGVSLDFPVTVVSDDEDNGKVESLYVGIEPEVKDKNGKVIKRGSLWKYKQTYQAVLNKEPATDAQGRLVLDTDEFAGKQAKGIWTLTENTGGKSDTPYPKLTSIVSVDTKVSDTPL